MEKSLDEQIDDIGNKMVNCDSAQLGRPCYGIMNCNIDVSKGIIPPRCLYLDEFRHSCKYEDKLIYSRRKKVFQSINRNEIQINDENLITDYFPKKEKSTNSFITGIVVIGKNPGKSKLDEQEEYKKIVENKKELYVGIKSNWKLGWEYGVHYIDYYNNINWLLNYLNNNVTQFNLETVLWTEIMKCEFDVELKTNEINFREEYYIYWLNHDIELINNKALKIIERSKCSSDGPYYEYEQGILKIYPGGEYDSQNLIQVLTEWQNKMIEDDDIDQNLIKSLYANFNDFKDENADFLEINFQSYFNSVLKNEMDELLKDEDFCKDENVLMFILSNSFDWEVNKFHMLQIINIDNLKSYKKKELTKLKNDLKLKLLPKIEKYFRELTLFRNSNDSNKAMKDLKEYFPAANECHRKYLSNELKVISDNWPILCVGKEEFKLISFAYPNRKVIGLPHVTGAHGHSPKIYDHTKTDYNKNRESISKWLEEKLISPVGASRFFDLTSE